MRFKIAIALHFEIVVNAILRCGHLHECCQYYNDEGALKESVLSLGVVSPHLPASKKFLRFCLV